MVQDVIRDIQDLRHLDWSRIRHSSGTAGSYLKAYDVINSRKTYYKLSCYDPVCGITGHECVNEIIADRLLTVLDVEHLHYQLIHALICLDGKEYDTYICSSEDFKEPGDSKIALDDYYALERIDRETILDFCIRQGWEDYIYTMLAVDYLILNRDRHGANVEILRNRRTGSVRPAPLFDHGISLIYSCRSEEEVIEFDPLSDKPIQCCVGSRSARKNLELIPKDHLPKFRPLEERDRYILMGGLEGVLPDVYLEKIWDMIWLRWSEYENMCHMG